MRGGWNLEASLKAKWFDDHIRVLEEGPIQVNSIRGGDGQGMYRA